jgi:uncharacterized protein (TIGR00296 family)
MEATKEHCYTCFTTLSNQLSSKSSQSQQDEDFTHIPLFVTWKITKSGTLRGCIGNLSPQPFPSGLKDYAIRAALHDTRFSKISLKELPSLTCGVSLLVNFVECTRWDEWNIGEHGILIKFKVESQEFRAVFLPEVASEQGWTKRETLDALIRKSGYRGGVDEKLMATLKVERFESSKAEASYDDWKAFLNQS